MHLSSYRVLCGCLVWQQFRGSSFKGRWPLPNCVCALSDERNLSSQNPRVYGQRMTEHPTKSSIQSDPILIVRMWAHVSKLDNDFWTCLERLERLMLAHLPFRLVFSRKRIVSVWEQEWDKNGTVYCTGTIGFETSLSEWGKCLIFKVCMRFSPYPNPNPQTLHGLSYFFFREAFMVTHSGWHSKRHQ